LLTASKMIQGTTYCHLSTSRNSTKHGVRVLVCIFNQVRGKHISNQTKSNSDLRTCGSNKIKD